MITRQEAIDLAKHAKMANKAIEQVEGIITEAAKDGKFSVGIDFDNEDTHEIRLQVFIKLAENEFDVEWINNDSILVYWDE